MTVIDAIILGIVEGLTEFLPVSSTGHLIITARALALPETAFLTTFEIVIQLGAIAAVALHGWKHVRDVEAMKALAVAFLPTAAVGLLFYEGIKSLLSSPTVVVWALAIGGVLLIVFEKAIRGHDAKEVPIREITTRQALVIGLCQSIAVIPGVSRAGASIVGGLAQGLPRATAVEFSFLLAIPTMLAATGLDLLKTEARLGPSEVTLLGVGLLVSFVVASAAVKYLLRYVRTRNFVPFGVYRVIAALLFWLVVI